MARFTLPRDLYHGKHFVEQDMPATDLDEAKVDPIKAPYRKGKKA